MKRWAGSASGESDDESDGDSEVGEEGRAVGKISARPTAVGDLRDRVGNKRAFQPWRVYPVPETTASTATSVDVPVSVLINVRTMPAESDDESGETPEIREYGWIESRGSAIISSPSRLVMSLSIFWRYMVS